MSFQFVIVISIAIAGLVLVLALWARKTHQWRTFIVELTILAACGVFLNQLFDYPRSPTAISKGPTDELIIAVAMFICMVFGMVSQHLYHRFARPKRQRPKWDWGRFFGPLFASPIVFIPLAASFEGAGINLTNFSAARMMIFLVAFQNGFFWKELFDRKQAEIKSP